MWGPLKPFCTEHLKLEGRRGHLGAQGDSGAFGGGVRMAVTGSLGKGGGGGGQRRATFQEGGTILGTLEEAV